MNFLRCRRTGRTIDHSFIWLATDLCRESRALFRGVLDAPMESARENAADAKACGVYSRALMQ